MHGAAGRKARGFFMRPIAMSFGGQLERAV